MGNYFSSFIFLFKQIARLISETKLFAVSIDMIFAINSVIVIIMHFPLSSRPTKSELSEIEF